jgi:hypothetical protein
VQGRLGRSDAKVSSYHSAQIGIRPAPTDNQSLANPNLHDIPTRLPFRVELWDRNDQHIRWVIAASSSVGIGHAALDPAMANCPDQRFRLRNGILIIREHVPKASRR